MRTMHQTRDRTVQKFVRKIMQNKNFSKWFCILPDSQIQTRIRKTRYTPMQSRTAAFARSVIPTMTNIAKNIIAAGI